MKTTVWRGLLVAAALVAGAQLARAQSPTDFFPRPIPMGVSISTWTAGSSLRFAGTAGMRVHSLRNPQSKFILSNAHVMDAVAPSLCPGTATPLRTLILQPGTLDIGSNPVDPSEFLAALHVAAVPIDFTSGASNLVDAAVAYTTDALASSTILGIGEPNPAIGIAAPGMQVRKSGRTTGVTTGSVSSVNATVLVNYGGSCGVARFVRQVITSAGLGSAGDSGSVVLEAATNTPVGLYFAGSPLNGVANQILFVYLLFGVFPDSAAAPPAAAALLSSAARSVDPMIGSLSAIQSRHEAGILAIPRVVGIGIGRNASDDGYEFVVYTTRLDAQVMRLVPQQLEGVPVRVVESGVFEAH